MGNNYLHSYEKESLTDSKQKFFEELANRRMEKIQNLSKQIDFNYLIYCFKDEIAQKKFVDFKGHLGFDENIMEDHIRPKKSEKKI